MRKSGKIIFIITILAVGTITTVASLYARGYRFNKEDGTIEPNGMLVLKSRPDGAQIFINGELKTATDATLSLTPGVYDVEIKKEGFLPWSKRITIEKEVVVETTAHIFKNTPSLSAITFSGATNPVPSRDGSKISYLVLPEEGKNLSEDAGLWIIETLNLPLGFTREPRRVTDGDLTGSTWQWSPNGREILLKTETGTYLLDTGKDTPQSSLTNIDSRKDKILIEWEEELDKKLNNHMRKLPEKLSGILKRKAFSILFSPDEKMLIYTASESATIPPNLTKSLPGSSTQKEERNIKPDHTYIYDIEEDKNFLIDNGLSNLELTGGYTLSNEKVILVNSAGTSYKRRLGWFPTSRHIVLAEENKITIMDSDGTNRQIVYSGSYIYPHAFPTVSIDRLLILTNLGADSTPSNLYSLSLK